MFNRKGTRIAVGLIMLMVLFFAVMPSLYIFNSVDGVVNGKIAVMKSPIEGVIHYPKKTAYGSYFKKGELIATVTNGRVNYSSLHELMTEKKTLEGRISSLEKRIATYSELSESLRKNLQNYQEFSRKQLEAKVKQDKQMLSEELVENKRAKAVFESDKVLDEHNAVAKRERDKNEAAYHESNERLIRYQNRIEELSNSLDAVNAGVFLGDGNNDSPYSKQRMDQLVIEISIAETALNEAKSRIVGIDEQIKTEQDRIEKAQKFELYAPFDTIVWRMPSVEGATVVIDSEIVILLDCGSIFLDVTVSESQFANLKPGDKIRYHLAGETKIYTGTVTALRGSGSVQGDFNMAASVNKDPRKEFRIWIDADPSDLDLSPETFFQVGRRVHAKIPRRWSVLNFIRRFVNVF